MVLTTKAMKEESASKRTHKMMRDKEGKGYLALIDAPKKVKKEKAELKSDKED